MTATLNVGIMGLGFIGRVHANAYHTIPLCFPASPVTAKISAVLRSHPGKDAFTRSSGFSLVTTSLEEFFQAPLDLVDICTPNSLHKDEALEAIQRGLPVYCEKPLARNLEEARTMAAAAAKEGVLTHTAFVLRYVPAIRQIKALLQAEELGEVFHFRMHMFHASYLDPNRPMSWRLCQAESGGGAFADLGAHLVDLGLFLLGPVKGVSANARTFIRQRPVAKGDALKESVDVDDWMHCMLEMESGAVGLVEVTRVAGGAGEETTLEIFGSQGAVAFHIAQPDALRFYSRTQGKWLQGVVYAPVPVGERPLDSLYPNAKFSQGMMTNVHLASAYDFLQCVQEGKPSELDFQSALAVQEVLEAAYCSAGRGGERLSLRDL